MKISASAWPRRLAAAVLPFLLLADSSLLTTTFADSLLDVELVAENLVAPLDLIFAPGDDEQRRFIVDQNGFVQVLRMDGSIDAEPFLNITSQVVVNTAAFDERGLLALAFHPDFVNNGKFYVHYSHPRDPSIANICANVDGTIPTEEPPEACPFQHTKRISMFQVPPDSDVADPDSEVVLFSVEWPGRKHNGGGLAFGPDGYLYIGLGDGGWVHGPVGNYSAFDIDPDLHFGEAYAQNISSLYGSILRIDVDITNDDMTMTMTGNATAPSLYRIPPDNPFADGNSVNEMNIPPEVFAWGFRNPFRMSFDWLDFQPDAEPYTVDGTKPLSMFVSATADTYFESTYKVDGPGNYGWATREGTHCLVRSSAQLPIESIACDSDDQCPTGPQVSTCGSDFCTCPTEGPLGWPIMDPFLEYLNYAVDEYATSGLEGQGFGRASLGGHLYRGTEIPWLQGKFVQGDFAITFLDGQILVATDTGDGGLWSLERAFTFDSEDPDRAGFMKAVGMDASGELYAVTGSLTASGLVGRVWKIVDGSGGDGNIHSETATPTATNTNAEVSPEDEDLPVASPAPDTESDPSEDTTVMPPSGASPPSLALGWWLVSSLAFIMYRVQ